MLATARAETGLAVVTEVMATEDVDLVARYADVLQIGARNMQNYRLLEAVGGRDKPVLLKRGPSATIEELLLAAEYILNAGNPNVMLCERGIRTFESHTRFTLPLATVVICTTKTHLPVVVDPSHGTGHTSLVPRWRGRSRRRRDGLILEVHPDPERRHERRLSVDHAGGVREGHRRLPQSRRSPGPAILKERGRLTQYETGRQKCLPHRWLSWRARLRTEVLGRILGSRWARHSCLARLTTSCTCPRVQPKPASQSAAGALTTATLPCRRTRSMKSSSRGSWPQRFSTRALL